jgi:molecular chaperone GrpE
MNTEDTNPPASDNPEQNQQAEQATSSESEKLAQEVADLKDKYVRAVAEMENMRRRMERERADLIKYGLENVFKDFLPVLDSLEKAMPEGEDAAKAVEGGANASYFEGMLMVKKQLLDVFKRHGLEAIQSKGAAFDPNVHQAIQRVESADVQVDTVRDEFARGYLLNGRLLRPAMVSVLTPQGS